MGSLKTVRLNPELIIEIQKLAEKENRSFSNMVETILQKASKHPDLVLSLK